MKQYLLTALICTTSILSGCATTSSGGRNISTEALCFLATTATGTGLGAAVDGGKRGIAVGALVGGLIGYALCDEDEKPVVAAAAAPGDSDGDGVTDDKDRCPNTPRGTRVDANGCPLDSDGDGVTDDKDRCPNTPSGTRVDANGCPIDADSDGDGVLDSYDACPNTPRGQKVDNRGCHVIFSLEGVNFAFDSDELTSVATAKLNEAVQMLKADPNVNVRIEGHTDNIGSEEYNQSLSHRRAQSVVRFLTSNGIDNNRLTSVGMGEDSPVASNETDQGRAQNRRVDFRVQN